MWSSKRSPQEQNAEADAITNGDFDWLSKERRIETSLDKLPFKVLHTLLAQGAHFYRDSEVVNQVPAPQEEKTSRTLRVRDPSD